jgi:hypothetical protein
MLPHVFHFAGVIYILTFTKYPGDQDITMYEVRGSSKAGILSKLMGMSVLALLLVSSCRHPSAPPKAHHKANIDYTKLFSRLQGRWISYEYILNLSKSKSPAASSPFMEGIFSFAIDSNRLIGDTVHCVAWINGHEDRDFWIAFDSPDSMGLFTLGINRPVERENEQRATGNENYTRIKIDSPFITIYTSTYDSVRYVYYDNLSRSTSSVYPMKHYTTAALFRGEYFTRDSNMIFGTSRIFFDPMRVGRIEGSPLYDSFDINVDLISQNDSVDYIELFDSRKQNESRSFIYSIRKNILRIYQNLDSTPCSLFKTDLTDTLPRP